MYALTGHHWLSRVQWLAVCLAGVFGGTVWAEATVSSEDGGERRITAARCATAPVIDGVFDEDCWGRATVAEHFTDGQTETPVKQDTRVRVAYDDVYVYFAVECWESDPDRIRATVRKHDKSLGGDDSVSVYLDTLFDRRYCYVFTVNSLGTRYDARKGMFGLDDNWDCDWQAGAKVYDDRWCVEAAIPIAGMLYNREAGALWGIQFRRDAPATQEHSYWSYYTSNAGEPREFGTLGGLDLSEVANKLRPAFEVYVSNTTDLRDCDTEFSTGVDVSSRLSPHFVGAATINPDYGQVEADPDTIELRDTERFLAEKRTFFSEGSELFKTPIQYYYSRRFQDIDWGGKITGQGDKWALGMLDVQGDIAHGGRFDEGHYHVGRLIGNVTEKATLGAAWAGAFNEDRDNVTGGVDARIFFDETTYLVTQFMAVKDGEGVRPDPRYSGTGASEKDSGYAGYSYLFGGAEPLEWSVGYQGISAGFLPDLGYITRRDIFGPGGEVEYLQYYESGPIRYFKMESGVNLYENADSETVLRDFDEEVAVGLRNDLEIGYQRKDFFHRPWQNYSDGLELEYREGVDFYNSAALQVERGRFEAVDYYEFGLVKRQMLGERLSTEIELDYRIQDPKPVSFWDEKRDRNVWLWRWTGQYYFEADARLKVTLENTSVNRHNVTVLFTWPLAEQLDFYLLLNDYNDGDERYREGFAKLVIKL